jgi:hypothetical protein
MIANCDDETYGNRDDEFTVSPGDGSPGNAEDDSDAGVGETALKIQEKGLLTTTQRILKLNLKPPVTTTLARAGRRPGWSRFIRQWRNGKRQSKMTERSILGW